MPRPQILPIREQNEIILQILRERLNTILPLTMREAEIDMWLIICQEDNYDPVFRTMIPYNTWTPILQMLVFYDMGKDDGIERINISMTDLLDLYHKPWTGTDSDEQWKTLSQIIQDRDPHQIGVNIGRINWASGGLTHNLYKQLIEVIPKKYEERVVSAEHACTRWLMTLSEQELELYPQIVKVTRWIIAECFSFRSITPGVTTTDDLEWNFWQTCIDLGLELAFKPFFRIIRRETQKNFQPLTDKVIRRGDLLHCDVGIRYLRLNSDIQELAYVLKVDEKDVPTGLKQLFAENNRLQLIFMDEFKEGLTGNQMLSSMLTRARSEGVPKPKIYSHSLGLYLHEPGPLIGLPWEQESCPGRGDTKLKVNSCFTMELSVEDAVPEWDNQEVQLATEQDVMFTDRGCEPFDSVQTSFHLI